MDANEIFRQYYSKLCDTLADMNEILPKCVTECIITINSKKKIDEISSRQGKAEKILEYIAGPLEEGYTEEFLILLKIMKEHGNVDTVQLVDKIESLMITSKGDVSGIVKVHTW